MKLSNQYEIEADSEEEAFEKLGDYLDSNNMTAETEFWDCIDVVLVDVEPDTEGVATECPNCNGTGNVDEAAGFELDCITCGGTGWIEYHKDDMAPSIVKINMPGDKDGG